MFRNDTGSVIIHKQLNPIEFASHPPSRVRTGVGLSDFRFMTVPSISLKSTLKFIPLGVSVPLWRFMHTHRFNYTRDRPFVTDLLLSLLNHNCNADYHLCLLHPKSRSPSFIRILRVFSSPSFLLFRRHYYLDRPALRRMWPGPSTGRGQRKDHQIRW